MADKSPIEWTDATWNPIAGCDIVSKGCTHCYAMAQGARIQRMAAGAGRSTHYDGTTKIVNGKPVWTGKIAVAPESTFLQPLRWKRPRMIFVNSMSDLFHENVSDEVIDRVFAVMALCPQHVFQVLTKRPERMRDYLRTANRMVFIARAGFDIADEIAVSACKNGAREPWKARPKMVPFMKDPHFNWPLPNVWLGTSIENQQTADERIPLLLDTPAAIRWISAEPLLEAVDLTNIRAPDYWGENPDGWVFDALATGDTYWLHGQDGIGGMTGDGPNRETKIDWVVVGGESGVGARPMRPTFAHNLIEQCKRAKVPVLFKQWGEYLHVSLFNWTVYPNAKIEIYQNSRFVKVGKKKAGRFIPPWGELNEYPKRDSASATSNRNEPSASEI